MMMMTRMTMVRMLALTRHCLQLQSVSMRVCFRCQEHILNEKVVPLEWKAYKLKTEVDSFSITFFIRILKTRHVFYT